MDVVIEVEQLDKAYGDHKAVDSISFSVRRGEIFGLLGPNGAGKTTTVEILQGLRSRDGGLVSVLGRDPATSSSGLRRRIGSQLQSSGLPARIKVKEAVELFASFAEDPVPADDLLGDWGLLHLASRPFARLSGGERQRLYLALALVGRPELVFLDELTTGLDPGARRETWRLVERVRDGGATVVLVTHFMDEAEQLCDRLAVVSSGRIVAEGTPPELVATLTGGSEVSFRTRRPSLEFLSELEGVDSVQRRGERIVVRGDSLAGFDVAAALAAHGIRPTDYRMRQHSLEDAFLALTKE